MSSRLNRNYVVILSTQLLTITMLREQANDVTMKLMIMERVY